MNWFNKYKLRIVLWLLGVFKIYHSIVRRKPLFPQESDPSKLKMLLIKAKKSVPYYKINLPDFDLDFANLIAEFEKVNFVLDKKVLKEDLSSLLDPTVFSNKNVIDNWKNSFGLLKTVWKKKVFLPISTSGYSGKPLIFYTSKALAIRSLMLFLASARNLGWCEGEVYMACMQGGMYAQANKIKFLMSLIGALPFVFKEMDEKAVKKFALNVNKYKPTILSSTPSFLSEMAVLLKKNNVPLTLHLKAIHSSGEMLFDYQRQQIEEAFGAKVYNIYGTNEIGLAAIECEARDGLHIFEEYLLLENDAENRILATVLDADFMPLIKYNTGDKGKISFMECSCGIKGKKIINLEGRIEDYLLRKDGSKVHASYVRQLLIESNLKFSNAILQGQFLQKKDGRICFKLELLNQQNSNEILKYIEDSLIKDLKMEAKGQISESLLQARGKFKFLLRE